VSLLGLEGKVVLITGAAAGIGAATAALFAGQGAALALCDREPTLADGDGPLRRVLDVRDHQAVTAFVVDIVDTYGRIDVVVNNAGGTFASSLLDVSAKGEGALIAENFTQVTHLVRQCVPHMPHGSSIVNVTTIEAHRAAPGFAVYAAMKAGQANLTKTLALELAPLGIRVNALAPDAMRSEGITALGGALAASGVPYRTGSAPPIGHYGTPDDAAGGILYLASDLAGFVTGITLHVDGGNLAAGGWVRTDPAESGSD
jgi:NAD(P)-dependent dehydrogenase (short-subunit alcohol dehydrogenase family)